MTRARQFLRAVFAKITKEDREYIKKYLNDNGQRLFFEMAIFDQAHAIMVAKTIETFDYEGNRDFLARIALLHDVGRRGVSVFDKVFCVLINAVSKKLAKTLSKYFHSLHIYYNHPQIGAELLKNVGFTREAEIILHHHENMKNPPRELVLLQKADELN